MSAIIGGREVLGPFVLALLVVLAKSCNVQAREEGSDGVTAEDGLTSDSHRHRFPQIRDSFPGTWTLPDPKARRIGPSPQRIPVERQLQVESPASLQDLSPRGDAEQPHESWEILGAVIADSRKASSEGIKWRSLEEYGARVYTNLAQAPLLMAELYKGPVRGESPPNPVGTRTRNLLNASKTKPKSADATADPEQQSEKYQHAPSQYMQRDDSGRT